jgi:hypothetical protein
VFAIGASWGGFESLILSTTGGIYRTQTDTDAYLGTPFFAVCVTECMIECRSLAWVGTPLFFCHQFAGERVSRPHARRGGDLTHARLAI